MSKIKSIYVLADVLKFLPMRKVLQVITYSKSLHETLGIRKEERSLLKRIYTTPLAPLHYTCRFSKKSGHINGFLYNKLKDYRSFIEEQSESVDQETFNTNFINYLQSLKNDFICMLDLNDQEGLELARKLPNLKFGLFLDYATNTQNINLSGINITYFSDNLEKVNADVRKNILEQLAECKNLDTMRITFPNELPVDLFQKLPKLRKIQIANNWRSGDELVKALNSIQHMGDKLESLTIYTFYKCIEGGNLQGLKEALSNFKKIKSLYFRMSIQETVPYEKFLDLFNTFAPTLEKLKFDVDIFDSKNRKDPITFGEFPNLKKVIIKNEKPSQCPYNLRHIDQFQLKYHKVPVHRGNLEPLKEPNAQGFHFVFDKEGYTEDEVKQIEEVIKGPNVKLLSFRGINCQINQILPRLSCNNIEELILNNVIGNWKLADILKDNPELLSLTLNSLGNPIPEQPAEVNNNIVSFPAAESKLKNLTIKSSQISDITNLFKYCLNLTSLSFKDLNLSQEDFIYFCEHIGELKKLNTVNYGKILCPNVNEAQSLELFGKFFENLSTIPNIEYLDFDSNFRLDVNLLSKLGKHLGHFKKLKKLKVSVIEPKDSFEARKILLQETEKLHYIKEFKMIMFDN